MKYGDALKLFCKAKEEAAVVDAKLKKLKRIKIITTLATICIVIIIATFHSLLHINISYALNASIILFSINAAFHIAYTVSREITLENKSRLLDQFLDYEVSFKEKVRKKTNDSWFRATYMSQFNDGYVMDDEEQEEIINDDTVYTTNHFFMLLQRVNDEIFNRKK